MDTKMDPNTPKSSNSFRSRIDRVLRVLSGDSSIAPELTRPGILVVADPTPSALVQLDPDKVLGMCAALGSVNSHSAILARSLDIPTLVGLGPALLQVADGTLLALDGQ